MLLRFAALLPLLLAGVPAAFGQIDPMKRELFQFGYNAAFQGHAPLAMYAFFYRNQPSFLEHTNLTLRMAVAPTYLDSELGISGVLTPHTDLGIGVAGGGFADSYAEIHQGKYLPEESFVGHGVELSASLYHLFNPGERIPLYGVVRGIAHYSFFAKDSSTAENFELPDNHGIFSIRSGLRWGGRQPVLFPSLAMELSIWEESSFRSESQWYGYNDRYLEKSSHLFWGQALLAYTLPKWQHNFYVTLAGGTSINADRFSVYRMGALLPLVSEFPLSLPGYYYQEISATDFLMFGGNYIIPLDGGRHWNLNFTATTALVNYLPGLEQPGHSQTGVGAGILYKSRTWRTMVGYGYGVDAMRSHGQGAHSLGILIQFDLESARDAFYHAEPSNWRGLQRIFGVLGS